MGEIVIVGGGLTAARVAQSYRESGGTDRVTLLASEPHPPYHRPPLTKRLLRGEAEPPDTLVATPDDFRDLDVELRLGTPAASLDLAARTVTLGSGRDVAYERLVIATGAAPRRLPVPGSDLEGVRTLRTLDDSLAIREAAGSARRVVVVGTGFIGLEVTASLRARGVEVTIVDAATAPFQALGAPDFSAFLAELYREHGVEMLLGDGIEGFSGNGKVEIVRTASGRDIEADLVVVGVGVAPSTAWLEDSGLELDNGVVVDSRLHASAEDVFAAGDVANFEDPIFRRRRRIEHWSNADYQGRLLGKVLAGEHVSYDRVSAFFTELFGTVYRFFGDSEGADRQELEGSFADGRAVVRYFDGGRLRAALATGLSDEEQEELEDQIRAGRDTRSEARQREDRGLRRARARHLTAGDDASRDECRARVARGGAPCRPAGRRRGRRHRVGGDRPRAGRGGAERKDLGDRRQRRGRRARGAERSARRFRQPDRGSAWRFARPFSGNRRRDRG